MESLLLLPVSPFNTWPGVSFCFLLPLVFITCYFILKQNKNQVLIHWPFIGALPSFLWNLGRVPEWLTELFLSLDNGVGTMSAKGPAFSNLGYLCTCHPQNLEYILKTNFSNFPKGSDFNDIFDFFGEGIVNVDGESWRLQRRMIHKSFNSLDFRGVAAKTSRKVVESQLVPFLAHVARQGSVIDFQDICSRLSFDSNMSALFGINEGYLSKKLPHNELAEAMEEAVEAVVYRHAIPMFCWKLLRFLNVGRERDMAKARKTIELIIGGYISNKRESLNKGEDNVLDLLTMLIKWSDELSKNDVFIRDLMVNLFFAGKDTVAAAIVWFFWLMAKTPSVENKLFQELKSVVLKKNSKDGKQMKWPCLFDFDEIKELVYLQAALCETLRLYSPIPFNSKGVLTEDVLPDGTVVKPGTQILISYYSEGRMPWIWGEDSLEFKPERWIDDDGKLTTKYLSKFFAFNVGPRSCLGKDISFSQLKVCVAAILFNFQLELVGDHPGHSKPSMVLTMKDGLLVKVHQRVL